MPISPPQRKFSADAGLRIMHLTTMNRIRSGGPMQLQRLAVEQALRGHRVVAVFGNNPRFRDDFIELTMHGVDVRFLNFDGFRPTRATCRAILALRRLVRAEPFDVVHVHQGPALDLLLCATVGIGIPIVANRGMSAPLSWRNAFKYRMSRVSRIVAVAENVKEVLVTSGAIDPGKIDVVYGSVDTDVFRPGVRSSLRRELGISRRQRVVGTLGSLGSRKGIPELLEAFAGLRCEYADTVLVVVGASDAEMARRNYVIPRSIRPFVYLVPFRPDAPNCLAAFDVFVFSGTRNEGLTGAVREAAAMALPIVTTEVGGNRELIRHGKEGWVVPTEDSDALCRGIAHLFRCPDLARRLGACAREAVRAKMTDDNRCDAIIRIYREVIGARPSSPLAFGGFDSLNPES